MSNTPSHADRRVKRPSMSAPPRSMSPHMFAMSTIRSRVGSAANHWKKSDATHVEDVR